MTKMHELAEALRAIRDAAAVAARMGDSIKRVQALEVIRDCADDVLRRTGGTNESDPT